MTAPERRTVERTNWKQQHKELTKQMEAVVGRDGFRFYYVDLPLPDLRKHKDEIPPTLRSKCLKAWARRVVAGEKSVVTVCVARNQRGTFFRGMSVCYPLDNPDRIKGRCYAMRRALRAYKTRKAASTTFTALGLRAFTKSGGSVRREVKDLIRDLPKDEWALGAYSVSPTVRERMMFVG